MATKTEQNTLGEGIKWEEGGSYSREKIVIASGNSVACLEVVGKITVGGKCVPVAPAAADGSEAAAGIMFAAIDATNADQAGVIINDHAMAAMDNLPLSSVESMILLPCPISPRRFSFGTWQSSK